MQQTKEPTRKKLLRIVAKASNLQERIEGDRNRNELSHNPDFALEKADLSTGESRRLEWLKVVAKGNEAKFSRRLKWSGLDPENILSLLTDYPSNCDIQEIPDWAITLERVIKIAPTVNKSDNKHFYLLSKPLPYEDFYLPFLKIAQEKLLVSHSQEWQRLSESAQTDLWQGLLDRLVNIGAATLSEEFNIFRLAKNSLKDLLSLQLSLNHSNKKYSQWIDELLSKDFENFFEKYSVLGRLLATSIDFWVSSTGVFLTHLTADWQAIQSEYSSQQLLDKVIAFKCNLSDVHNQGKAVIIVTFNTRLKVVYKPRDLSLEIAFYKLVDWYNERSQLLSLPSLKLLNYQTHGWSEYVAALPCEDEEEVKKFYQRSGILICLVHVLAGQDFHGENLIAKGEFPVLVDLEALLHSEINLVQTNRKDALTSAYQQLQKSVFKTYLLPQWRMQGKDSVQIDLGGLGDMTEESSLYTLTWRHINTDNMQLDREIFKLDYDNSPILEGTKISAAKYVKEVVWGFDRMYDFLMKNKLEILSENSILKLLEWQKVRFLFRDTNTYSRILQKSYHPDFLQYGIDRSIALDALSRGFISQDSKPNYWQILDAEINSVEQLDIPLFTSESNSNNLQLSPSEIIPQVLAKHSLSKVIDNIKNLSEADKKQQLYFIESAFAARFIQQPQWSEDLQNNVVINPENTSSNDLLIAGAISIAESLAGQVIRGEDDSLAWFGLDYKSATDGFNFQPLNQLSLADGNLGIALFFAALAKTTGEEKWHNLAWQIINPIINNIAKIIADPAKFYRQIKIGGVDGLGTSAYGLIKIARLLDAPSLIPIAEILLSLVTLDRINSSTQLNVISGTGSTLLSLLGCLDEKLPNSSECLKKAIACGNHLLQHQAPPGTEIDPKNLSYWRGISGVAYGLLRLSEVTGNRDYAITAINAISLESMAIEKLNLEGAKIDILLGRIGAIACLNTPQIKNEIEGAISLIKQQQLWGNNNLFWGNCGRLEMLSIAAQKLEKPQLNSLIHSWGNAIAKQTIADTNSLKFPSFLHGMSGIGYQFLRIANPDFLPSILIWE